jgi:hypothetical protein
VSASINSDRGVISSSLDGKPQWRLARPGLR